ncbi:hypothetical protein RBG61_00505 [Paludicola sp. MB14-C6]|uniref:hypothetical protein n=1 Tax=Paludihabitans sp. MB14-C6 TaxID=3070656 RepID=UPI0027DDFA82|nr:hypothetical protein [Paludicola sp. MB14-C6]WMJ23171.1 hypothetical protein RBG61_00505 [Paludicola sp. MB14-C6]
MNQTPVGSTDGCFLSLANYRTKLYNYYSGDSYTSSETSSSNNLSSGIDYGQAKAQRKAEEAQRRQAEIEKQKRYVNFKACTSLINPEKYAQEYKELLQKESKEYNEYINQFPSLNWLTADEQLLFQHSDFLESFTEQEKIKLIVLGRERSITMDDIKKLYIDEDLTNKGVMDFFNTSLRANRFGMTTTDLDTHFQQGKKTERSALLDFAGMYAAAGWVANYNASGSNFSNVPEGQFKGFNLDKPKVNNSASETVDGGSTLGKGFDSFNDAKKFLGSPGEGNQWHHIVEQSQIQKSGFSNQLIQNTDNLIAVDKATHAKISGYYNTKSFDFTGGLSVRDWLAGQSYEKQYEFGMNVLKQFGVIK